VNQPQPHQKESNKPEKKHSSMGLLVKAKSKVVIARGGLGVAIRPDRVKEGAGKWGECAKQLVVEVKCW
jgi:hypothetical protein